MSDAASVASGAGAASAATPVPVTVAAAPAAAPGASDNDWGFTTGAALGAVAVVVVLIGLYLVVQKAKTFLGDGGDGGAAADLVRNLMSGGGAPGEEPVLRPPRPGRYEDCDAPGGGAKRTRSAAPGAGGGDPFFTEL